MIVAAAYSPLANAAIAAAVSALIIPKGILFINLQDFNVNIGHIGVVLIYI